MFTINTHVTVNSQMLSVPLEGVPAGDYEIVIVLNPTKIEKRETITFG
jgi:hypothetical protein